MTDHPLTDEICKNLSLSIAMSIAAKDPKPCISPRYISNDMRAAYHKGYDKGYDIGAEHRLKQVMQWHLNGAKTCQTF